MKDKPFIDTQALGKQGTSDKLGKGHQYLGHDSRSYKALADAIDKYEQAVQRYVDPEITSEETLLIVSALLEKLANSFPKYLEGDSGIKQGIIDLIEDMRKKSYQNNNSFKAIIITSIQKIFVKTFSFFRTFK